MRGNSATWELVDKIGIADYIRKAPLAQFYVQYGITPQPLIKQNVRLNQDRK